MQRHSENTLAVARHLQKQSRVLWVNYPGLDDNPWSALRKKYMPEGGGALLTFGIKGGFEAGKRFINSVKLFSLLANTRAGMSVRDQSLANAKRGQRLRAAASARASWATARSWTDASSGLSWSARASASTSVSGVGSSAAAGPRPGSAPIAALSLS